MISVYNIVTPSPYQWETVIKGMRNPMNSWDKSDSVYGCDFEMGKNDLELMKKLCKAGTEHRKFMRMIPVYMDVVAPLYWWKEADTYKVGTVSNSCSTMHKLHSKDLTIDDFSHEKLYDNAHILLVETIHCINAYRKLYNKTKDKQYWYQMIQLLPSSYNQQRTLFMNYEVAANIIKQRNGHKLDEWKEFVDVLMDMPYMREITGE